MSPASGDKQGTLLFFSLLQVSIQLMSPASGDFSYVGCNHVYSHAYSFHSINVPSEWGLYEIDFGYTEVRQVSIQLMSPASGDFIIIGSSYLFVKVSIQLMSPASGDIMLFIGYKGKKVFPFN